jgi:hypothetical protein
LGTGPVLRKSNTCKAGMHIGKANMCKADTHAGKATRARQTCMQKRKACEAHMQEDLAMIGLGFW